MRRAHENVLGEHQPTLYAFDAAGAGYALGGAARSALLVDTEGHVHELAHRGAVEALAFGTRWLATGSRDMGVRFFAFDGSLHRLCKGHYNRITALCWLDDDTLVSASVDGRVGIFRPDEPWMVCSVVMPATPRALARSDAGIVVGTDEAIHVLSRDLAILRTIEQPARSVSASGSLIVARWLEMPAKIDRVSVFDGSASIWSGEATAAAIRDDVVAIGTAEGILEPRRGTDFIFRATPHDSEIISIVPTPFGWLTGGRDGLAQLTSWDGEALGGTRHRAGVVHCATVGEQLITVGSDAEVAIWNAEDAEALVRPRRMQPVRTLQLASGAAIAFGEGSSFGVSTKEGFHVLDAVDADVHEVIEPDEPHWYGVFGSGVWGTRVGADRMLALMRAGRVLAKLDGFYAPQIVGPCVLTDALECWRLSDDGVESVVRSEGSIHGCSIAPSGRWAWLAAKDASICVDVDDGELQRFEPCNKSAFSHDEALVAYATQDAVVVHDVRAGRTLHRLPLTRVWALSWSPCEHRIAIATSERVVYMVDAQTGQIETTLRAAEQGAAGYTNATWSRDGKRVATSTQFAKAAIFELDGTRVATLEGINSAFVSCRMVGERILAWSNVIPNPDLTLQLWTFDGELVAQLAGHRGEKFWQVNPSRCGRWVASLVDGDRVRVWSTEDGACTILPVSDAVGADFGDDVCVTVERDGRVSVFEL